MSNKALRVLNQIQACGSQHLHDQIVETCGMIGEKAGVPAQARYVATLMGEMEKSCDTATINAIMGSCGHACCGATTAGKAKELYAQSNTLADFLDALNQKHIGGGHLRIHRGKIIGEYHKCYCGIAKAAKGLSENYCLCSAGWFEHLFSSAFGQPVRVKKIQTILAGAQSCQFEISIPREIKPV